MIQPNWTNLTDLTQLPAVANTVSEGAFWTAMLYMIWVVSLLATLAFGFETALVVSSFIGLALGILLVYAGLVAWQWVMTFIALMIFAFIYIGWNTRQKSY